MAAAGVNYTDHLFNHHHPYSSYIKDESAAALQRAAEYSYPHYPHPLYQDYSAAAAHQLAAATSAIDPLAHQQHAAAAHAHAHQQHAAAAAAGAPASVAVGASQPGQRGRKKKNKAAANMNQVNNQHAGLTRDERKAAALNLPIPVRDIIHLPMDEFNDLLSKHELTEDQLTLCRDIRRRGKNKVS